VGIEAVLGGPGGKLDTLTTSCCWGDFASLLLPLLLAALAEEADAEEVAESSVVRVVLRGANVRRERGAGGLRLEE
jgi:hypothetical protein